MVTSSDIQINKLDELTASIQRLIVETCETDGEPNEFLTALLEGLRLLRQSGIDHAFETIGMSYDGIRHEERLDMAEDKLDEAGRLLRDYSESHDTTQWFGWFKEVLMRLGNWQLGLILQKLDYSLARSSRHYLVPNRNDEKDLNEYIASARKDDFTDMVMNFRSTSGKEQKGPFKLEEYTSDLLPSDPDHRLHSVFFLRPNYDVVDYSSDVGDYIG